MFCIKRIHILIVLIAIFSFTKMAHANDPNYYALGLKAEFSGDTQGALDYYTLAAEKGLPDAKFALGRLYRDAFADAEYSFKWFKEAAEQGSVYAQYELGQIFYKGNYFIEADKNEAIKWFTHAADGGKHAEADFMLFKITDENSDKLRWLQQAANQGLSDAMQKLGEAYNKGELGLQVDTGIAKYWLQKAASSQE